MRNFRRILKWVLWITGLLSAMLILVTAGLKANLIREKDGLTNLGAWLTQLKTPREPTEPTRDASEEKEPVTSFILPGDLTAKIKLTHVQLRVEDRMERFCHPWWKPLSLLCPLPFPSCPVRCCFKQTQNFKRTR